MRLGERLARLLPVPFTQCPKRHLKKEVERVKIVCLHLDIVVQ
jgi:hypothetical protein